MDERYARELIVLIAHLRLWGAYRLRGASVDAKYTTFGKRYFKRKLELQSA